jgi:hypothetical protein
MGNTRMIMVGVTIISIASCCTSTKYEGIQSRYEKNMVTEEGRDFRDEVRHKGRREGRETRDELRHKGRIVNKLGRILRKN